MMKSLSFYQVSLIPMEGYPFPINGFRPVGFSGWRTKGARPGGEWQPQEPRA